MCVICRMFMLLLVLGSGGNGWVRVMMCSVVVFSRGLLLLCRMWLFFMLLLWWMFMVIIIWLLSWCWCVLLG